MANNTDEMIEKAMDAGWQKVCDDWQNKRDEYRLNAHSYNRGFREGAAFARSLSNEGWVRLETEDDLPSVTGDYLFKRRLAVPDQDMGDLAYEFKRLDDPYFTTLFSTNHNKEVWLEKFSHWQKITPPSHGE